MTSTPRGPITLRPVTGENWEAIARLQVHPDQAGFVETNIWSLAECGFYPALHPVGIYQGSTPVGFLMWGTSPDDNRPWLFRLMIDQQVQQRGLGSTALDLLLKQLRKSGLPELNVGYHRDNIVAEKLYLNAGFRKGGLTPWGELSARIDF